MLLWQKKPKPYTLKLSGSQTKFMNQGENVDKEKTLSESGKQVVWKFIIKSTARSDKL